MVPVEGISAIVENLVLLRFVEFRARLHRLLSVMKVRGSDFDPRLREFCITDVGITLADTFESAESILSGFGTERQVDDNGGKRRRTANPGKKKPAGN
jgi:circadian clock protein KaiC